jgi:hypothetical protein
MMFHYLLVIQDVINTADVVESVLDRIVDAVAQEAVQNLANETDDRAKQDLFLNGGILRMATPVHLEVWFPQYCRDQRSVVRSALLSDLGKAPSEKEVNNMLREIWDKLDTSGKTSAACEKLTTPELEEFFKQVQPPL